MFNPNIQMKEVFDAAFKYTTENDTFLYIQSVPTIRTKFNEFINSRNISNKELHIFKLKYYNKLTLAEIGQMYGISKERVRQIIQRCIQKMQKVIQRKPDERYN